MYPAGATAPALNSGSGVPTPRESQVAGQFARLAEATKYLQDRISVLHQRLEPILREEPVDPQAPQEKRSLVRHAEGLANFADALDLGNAALDDILRRLEI